MIRFVLDGARQQSARAKRNGLEFFVESLHVHKFGPRNLPENFRKTQASFAAGHRFAVRLDFGIDKDERHDGVEFGGFAVEFECGGAIFAGATHVDDGELQGLANLLCRQPDAVRVATPPRPPAARPGPPRDFPPSSRTCRR